MTLASTPRTKPRFLTVRLPAWPEGAFALRLVLAASAAFFATEALHLGRGYSAVLSALIVVRPYQQGALLAGGLRILATLSGLAIAFASGYLLESGLPDYARLLLVLAPLSLIAAYESSYRTALISAVLMLSAPSAPGSVADAAIGRALVVCLGAVIGVFVSVLVLPRPHKQVVADQGLRILHLILSLTRESLRPSLKPRGVEAQERKLRQRLLDLGQMGRDGKSKTPEDDASTQIIGLVRHAQALALLLRSGWRRMDLSEADIAARAAILQALADSCPARGARSAVEAAAHETALAAAFVRIKGLERQGAEDPQKWLLVSLARDIAAVVQRLEPAA